MLFPAPFAPMMPIVRPASTEKVIPLSAQNSSRLLPPRSSDMADDLSVFRPVCLRVNLLPTPATSMDFIYDWGVSGPGSSPPVHTRRAPRLRGDQSSSAKSGERLSNSFTPTARTAAGAAAAAASASRPGNGPPIMAAR